MDCHHIEERLSSYVEGSISSEERILIEEHVKVCRKCNESLDDLRKTIEYVRHLKEIEPPAWLTQKIMAKIESAPKPEKGIWRKLFYPLHVKLPIEAAAVVLIAVTAIYIFKSVQPEVRFAKVPSEETAPQILLEQKDATGKESSIKKGSESEKPATAGKPERAHTRGEAMKTPEPAKQDRVMHSPGAPVKDEPTQKALSGIPQTKVFAERKKDVTSLTVRVKDRETAGKELQKALIQLGGKVTSRESFGDRDILTAELDSKKLQELIERMKLLGEVEGKERASEGPEGDGSIRIEILNISMRPQ
jgi:hypothetical protein